MQIHLSHILHHSPTTGGKPAKIPKLTELYLGNDLKTNSVCVGAHTTVYKILKEKQQSQSLFSAFLSATQSSLRHLAAEEKPKSNLLRYC